MRGRALGPGKLLRVDRGSGPQWVLDYRGPDGRRARVQLGPDRRTAERRRMELIQERDSAVSGFAPVQGQGRALADLRDLYVADLGTRVCAKQLRNVTDRLQRVLQSIPARRVRDLQSVQLLRLRSGLVAKGRANRTANLYVDALNGMLRWSVRSGLLSQNPLEHLQRLPMGAGHEKRVRRAMTDEEIVRFLQAATDDDRSNEPLVASRRLRNDVAKRLQLLARRGRARVPQRPLWEFLVRYGARYGEARTLVWGDVDFEQAVLSLRAETTKTRRARCVPISREFAETLAELRKLQLRALGRAVGAADAVFLSPEGRPLREDTRNARRVFDRLLGGAGIERIDALGRRLDVHALRGTCASALARRGVGIAVAQRLLGHTSPVMTSRHYTRLDAEDLRQAIEQPAATESTGQADSPRKRSR